MRLPGRLGRHIGERHLAIAGLVFGGLLVTTFLALSAILGVSLVERAKSDARSMASALEQYAIRTLEIGELIAEDARSYLLARGQLDALAEDPDAAAYFTALNAKLPAGSAIIFVDRTGKLVLRSDEYPTNPVDLSDRSWFQEVLQQRSGSAVGAAIHSRIIDRKIFVYTEALRGDDGTFLGAVNLGIPADAVIGRNALPNYGADVSLTLFRRDGTIVARNVFPDYLVGRELMLPPEYLAPVEDAQVSRRPADQRLTVTGIAPIPDHGLVAVAAIPMDSVVAPLRNTLLAGIPMLLLVLAGTYYALVRLGRQQAALDDSAEQMETVLDSAHLGAWSWHVPTGQAIFNTRWAEMLGYRLDEIEPHARSWQRLIHPDDRGGVDAALTPHLEGRIPNYGVEHRLRHKDGHWIWILASGRVVERDAQGRPVRMVGTHLDITERKASEDRLRVLMAEVDHRAKNTLAVVQAIINLTRAETVSAFKAAIQGRIAALAGAHSLLARNRWSGVDLQDIVLEELAAFGLEAGAGLSFDGPRVRLTPAASEAIAMALHELATNAAKHGALSDGEGRVALSWTLLPSPDGDLEITWRETGGPPVFVPRHRGVGSTVITESLVSQLGGTAEMLWKSGGLVCRLSVPARHIVQTGSVASAGAQAAMVAPDAPPPVAGGRILVVEDNALLAFAVKQILIELGHTVVGPAHTVAQAVDLIEHATLDAAVLDINLNGELIFPVAENLAERDIPFAFVTGYEDPNVLEGRFVGAPILRKPYDPKQLRDCMRDLLAQGRPPVEKALHRRAPAGSEAAGSPRARSLHTPDRPPCS